MNILITGANRGIGLALCQDYIDRGDSVYAVCRQSSAELRAMTGINIIDGVDVTNDQDLVKLKSELGNVKLDTLINNAGILTNEVLGELDFAAIERQFQVNAIGPLKTTQTLLDNLSAGSKVALVTSRMGSIADNGSGGYYGYRMSKTALNSAGMSLTQDLKPKNIAVAILHPGFVKTALVNHQGNSTPEEASAQLVARIDELNIDNTGTFWHANGEVLPW